MNILRSVSTLVGILAGLFTIVAVIWGDQIVVHEIAVKSPPPPATRREGAARAHSASPPSTPARISDTPAPASNELASPPADLPVWKSASVRRIGPGAFEICLPVHLREHDTGIRVVPGQSVESMLLGETSPPVSFTLGDDSVAVGNTIDVGNNEKSWSNTVRLVNPQARDDWRAEPITVLIRVVTHQTSPAADETLSASECWRMIDDRYRAGEPLTVPRECDGVRARFEREVTAARKRQKIERGIDIGLTVLERWARKHD